MGNQEKGKGLMESQNSADKLTALVVDDDKLVRMIHQGLLKRAGVKNEAVKNGKEAVDIHYSGQRFDIILMDKEMPIMTGIEATKKLRSMGILSKIIGVSSCTEAKKQEFLKAGIDDYQVKPLTIGVLNSILEVVKARK
ncbi:two-component response regulator 24-like [Trifolium pratense]|uniref:two-component response regulator 24-like n=1 Tax=Trifolium pratense TaxID=57577 RepID=UPI001E6949FA|nr:two-component response regulator 24-like [Trifolium pratense]